MTTRSEEQDDADGDGHGDWGVMMRSTMGQEGGINTGRDGGHPQKEEGEGRGLGRAFIAGETC